MVKELALTINQLIEDLKMTIETIIAMLVKAGILIKHETYDDYDFGETSLIFKVYDSEVGEYLDICFISYDDGDYYAGTPLTDDSLIELTIDNLAICQKIELTDLEKFVN